MNIKNNIAKETKEIVETEKEFLDDNSIIEENDYATKKWNQDIRFNKDNNREEINKATSENQLR